MTTGVTLSCLPPDEQDAIVAVLADEAERSGDPRPLGRALAGGDVLGGRDPASVPAAVRGRVAVVLTRRLRAAACADAPDCPHPLCRDDG
jgi:hypothetical protein